jgi:hypothetical protein
MYTVSSKSADANAARVEAAANDKLKRGEAANQYSSFDEGVDATTAATQGQVKQTINQIHETSFTNTKASDHTKASDQPASHFYPQTN